MKRILVVAALVLFVVPLPGEQMIQDNSIEQAARDAEHRWEEALKQFDLETMQSLLAEDDVQTDFRGVVQDKASWIQGLKQVAANVRSGVSEWEIAFDEEKVRAYGDFAIVTGRGTCPASTTLFSKFSAGPRGSSPQFRAIPLSFLSGLRRTPSVLPVPKCYSNPISSMRPPQPPAASF